MDSDPADSTADTAAKKGHRSSRLFKPNIPVTIILVILAFIAGVLLSGNIASKVPYLKSKIIEVPLNIDSPSVYRASFVYAFRTKVVNIEEKDGKTILKTELTGINNLPEFIIDDNTVIALIQNNNETKVKSTNLLTPGTSIYLYLAYNLKEQKWLTTRIAIINPTITKIPIPSPSIRPSFPSGKLKQIKN